MSVQATKEANNAGLRAQEQRDFASQKAAGQVDHLPLEDHEVAQRLAEHFLKSHVELVTVGRVTLKFREPTTVEEQADPFSMLSTGQQEAFLEITEDDRKEASKRREQQLKQMMFRSA